MIRFYVTSFAFMLAVSVSSAYAETYSWTDEHGTIHFTEDFGKVPQKFRSKAKRENETSSSQEEKPATKAVSDKSRDMAPLVAPVGGNGNDGAFGKKYDQVQKGLADRDAAMTAVRKRIDEIAARLNGYSGSWDEQKKLLLEHKSLRNQLKEMKAEYLQQVEAARKAGFQVNIQE